MQVTIHYERPGKSPDTFYEGLVSDNDTRLRTYILLPEGIADSLSLCMHREGRIASGRRIHSVAKRYFYREYFDVIEFRDEEGSILGFYSDIVTPLRKISGEYFLTDLVLDLWLSPDGIVYELDWEEYREVATRGLISVERQRIAESTFDRLRGEIALGIYPAAYLE